MALSEQHLYQENGPALWIKVAFFRGLEKIRAESLVLRPDTSLHVLQGIFPVFVLLSAMHCR
jgi:hypothetical protein